jgi:hypothetical protein
MEKVDPTKRVAIPVTFLPGFRTHIAIQNGVEKNLLFKTWGGLGDQICAEPTLRYALKVFKDCKVSLLSEAPDLFSHLDFHEVFDAKKVTPNLNNYLCFETITPPDDSNLVWQFFSHMLTNCVDFPSMCALRLQLPIADKEIILKPKVVPPFADTIKGSVLIHAGRHWPSKTFPKKFWDDIIYGLLKHDVMPILIGADTDDNRGTVDVDATHCLDLRNKLSVMESVWACQNASVLLTNDSSPMHMAASGDAWIGYFATCKHPDMITHWRHGKFQWREKNFCSGGIWDIIDFCPNKEQEVSAEFVPQDILESWLPKPIDVVEWAVSRKNGHDN